METDGREAVKSRFVTVAFILVVASCDGSGITLGDATDDPSVDSTMDLDATDPCDTYTDSDGDTIADSDEGRSDFDGDGVPNHLDLDSDGDTILDAVEAGDDDICTHPVNSDWESYPTGEHEGDEFPDFLDLDSDDDDLLDSRERELGTDPTEEDTDVDGVSDYMEICLETDPTDPTSTLDPEIFFIILYHMGEHEFRELNFSVSGDGPQDVTATAADLTGWPCDSDVDAACFVKDIQPYHGFPAPPHGYSSMDETTFYGVNPGTHVTFQLDFHNDCLEPTRHTDMEKGVISVLGDSGVVVDEREYVVLVPREESLLVP